jgi:hypothetical protein
MAEETGPAAIARVEIVLAEIALEATAEVDADAVTASRPKKSART